MRLPLASLVAVTLAAAPLAAQAHASPSSAAPRAAAPVRATPSTAADSALAQMRTRLRDLVVAQERHWMEHGTYTTDISALGFYDKERRTPPDSAFAQVISAGGRGWSGVATHRALRGKSCVIYVGNADELPRVPVTASDRTPAASEGRATCDAP